MRSNINCLKSLLPMLSEGRCFQRSLISKLNRGLLNRLLSQSPRFMSQYHRVPAEGELPSDPVSEESKELGVIPCKPHSSRITSVCACNCGRIQDHREDPFDVKVRNHCFGFTDI